MAEQAARAWYIVEAKEGRDWDARVRLANAGVEVWRPTTEIRKTRRISAGGVVVKKAVIVREARFGNYLFVRVDMSESLRAAIVEHPEIVRWVCLAGSATPAKVPDALIDFYKAGPPETKDERALYAKGALVRIIAGPFTGLSTVVEKVDSRGVLLVELDLFGRPTPTPIEAGHVELVAHAKPRPIKRNVKTRRPTLAGASA